MRNQTQTIAYKISWILMLILLVTAILGPWIKPHGIEEAQKIIFRHRAGAAALAVSPPFAPDAEFWLGTDHRGYDLLSLILNGMRYTLGFAFFITMCRFAIGIVIGFVTGISGKGIKLVNSMQLIFTSVPVLIFLYPPLSGLYRGLGLGFGLPFSDPNQIHFAVIYVVSVVLVGVFTMAQHISALTMSFRERLFVVSARMMGASTGRIIREHIVPNIREELSFIFIGEYVQVLSLMGQLAILGIFVGGGEQLKWDDGSQMSLTTSGEWCALLAYGIKSFQIYPWIILSVASFFLAAIWIVHFFLAQLQKRRLTRR